MVEHNVANVVVAGSTPVSRSKFCEAKFGFAPQNCGAILWDSPVEIPRISVGPPKRDKKKLRGGDVTNEGYGFFE